MHNKPDSYWRGKLTADQYNVMRLKGTERPFSGSLLPNKISGMYVCVGCGQELFSSKTKFDSGTGWPSFWDRATPDSIKLSEDTRHGLHRKEVSCKNCGAHLGHLFPDGPRDKTGDRYCINSIALDFEEKA